MLRPQPPASNRSLFALVILGLLGAVLAFIYGISFSDPAAQEASNDRLELDQPKAADEDQFELTQSQATPEGRVELDQHEVAPVVGAHAPDFALQNLDGEWIRLSDLRGSPILINFWATWCGPCRLEMPLLQQRFDDLVNQGFVVLGVNFDEAERIVEAFGEELGLTFHLLLDPGAQVQRLYRLRGYPTSFFVDRSGVIQAHHIGLMSMNQIDENIAKIGIDT